MSKAKTPVSCSGLWRRAWQRRRDFCWCCAEFTSAVVIHRCCIDCPRCWPALRPCFFFAALSSRLLVPPAALTMTALFALSDRMIWHTVEVKPYAIDTFVAAMMLWLFFSIKKAGAPDCVAFTSGPQSRSGFHLQPVFVYGGLMIVLIWQTLLRSAQPLGGGFGWIAVCRVAGGCLFLGRAPPAHARVATHVGRPIIFRHRRFTGRVGWYRNSSSFAIIRRKMLDCSSSYWFCLGRFFSGSGDPFALWRR